MRDSYGRWFPYEPEPYQVEWHKKFILANPDEEVHENRLWNKCRGIGATAITMMDLLMMAATYDGLTIPVTSMTGKQALKGPIWWGLQHCDNTVVPGLIPRDPNINSEIRIESTGSTIFLIPGSSPQTLRTYRTPVMFLDEFDWCDYQRDILDAGEMCMSEGGQISVVSTIQNVTGEFQRIIDNADDLDYWVYQTPQFDPQKLDPTRPLQEQIDEGLIEPLAPWVNIKLLDRQRSRRLEAFMRENMCYAPDTGVNFLDWELISKACSIQRRSAENPYGWVGDMFEKMTEASAENHRAITVGWDFSRYIDLSVAEVLDHTPFGVRQIAEFVMKGSDTPTQNKLLDQIVYNYAPTEVRIDMTGSGTGLYDYAFLRHGSKIDGIHFSTKVDVEDEKARLKDVYAINLRTLMQDNKLALFDYLELKDDLHSVPYDLSDPRRTQEGSHGDRFWALALASMPPAATQSFGFYR
jgi:hypothetical protein